MKKQLTLISICLSLLMLGICTLWSCTSGRTPQVSNDLVLSGAVVSCGHLNIYQLSKDNKSYLQVIINTSKIDLTQNNTWDLSSKNEGVTIRFREFEEEVSSRLCTDIRQRKIKPVSELEALTGELNLSMTEANWQNYKNGTRYKVDVQATGIKLSNEKSYALSIDQAPVGWLPG